MNADIYIANRHSLVQSLKGGVAVVRAYASMQQSADMAAHFTQESNFLYLTGVNAPDWTLIIDGSQNKSWLVAPEVSEIREIFDGSQNYTDAITISGVDKVIDTDQATKLLRELSKKHSIVYTIDQPSYSDNFGFVLNPALRQNRHVLERTFTTVQPCNKELAKLRAIKQPYEIEALQRAINHTITAFELIKSRMQSYRYEYEIEADFSHSFRVHGLVGHAYEPIIASSANACTLHYCKNSTKLKRRNLVLLDVGAQYNGYAADITRTYATSEPTKRQRNVHDAVERAHHEIIALLKPELSVESYNTKVLAIMDREIAGLGLITSGDEAGLRKYFPHAISHGLGLDVHDSLGSPRFFQPNMVLTVEPGIYIPEEGIGVRIEDDIRITTTGYVNMSATLQTSI